MSSINLEGIITFDKSSDDDISILRPRKSIVGNDIKSIVGNDIAANIEIEALKLKNEVTRHLSWKVCHYRDLPQWMQNNEHLHDGHRPPLNNYSTCFWSILRLHTETGNIWTHGIAFMLFIWLSIEYLSNFVHDIREQLIFGCFFAGSMICFLMSTLFHTLNCHSHGVSQVFARVDYCGIIAQIFGSAIPLIYYSFYCSPPQMQFWFGFGIVFCIASITVSLSRHFNHSHYRMYRSLVFMVFSICGVIPAYHWFHIMNWDFSMPSFYYFWIECGIYIFGALLYSYQIPERFAPGKCDYCWQSHQLFHVTTIIGALLHIRVINEMSQYRHMTQCM